MSEMGIHKAIVEVMREVGAIGKDHTNPQQNFKFRSIEDVYNRVQPLLAKHGIYSVPTILDQKREQRPTKSGGSLNWSILTVEYTFFSEDGSFVKASVVGEGMDSGDKSSNKAMAAAHKYAICQVFNIPYRLEDPDRSSPESGNGVTFSQLNDLKKRWLAANPILNGQSKEIIIPMFTKWVGQSVGRDFDPTRTDQWTPVDLRSCMALVDGSQRKQTAAAELCSEGDEDYADPKTGEIHRWAIGISAEMKAATNLDAIMAVVNRRAAMCTDVDQKAALDKVAEDRINEIAVSEKKGDN